MPPTPKFVERLARLPEVFAVLSAYPAGLTLQALATQFAVKPEIMRQDLLTFMDIESWGWMYDIFRPPVLEFTGADDEGDDPAATVVRVVHEAPGATLGVEHLSAGDLALLYTAGLALLDVDSEDEDLRDALGVIAETMYGEPATQPSPAEWNRLLPILQQAQAEQRRVDIVYSNTWRVGVSERTIEPLRLMQTQRGWEVDAGPLDGDGRLRTFLLSNVRSASLLEETFLHPSQVESRLARQRRTTSVRMALSQAARWAPDMYAEKVTVLDDLDAEFVADLELLPPIADRVALLMLASGGNSRVLEPGSVSPAASEVLMTLLDHHSGKTGNRPRA